MGRESPAESTVTPTIHVQLVGVKSFTLEITSIQGNCSLIGRYVLGQTDLKKRKCSVFHITAE